MRKNPFIFAAIIFSSTSYMNPESKTAASILASFMGPGNAIASLILNYASNPVPGRASVSEGSETEKYYQCRLICRSFVSFAERKDAGMITVKAYPEQAYKKMTPACKEVFGNKWYDSTHFCVEYDS